MNKEDLVSHRGEGEVIATAQAVWKSYDSGRIEVLRGASLTVRAGEVVALWGASGSGKSTLLHLLGGLDVPDRGHLQVCGLDPVNEAARLTLRRSHVGFVFQLHNLIADLTVEENLLVPSLAVGGSSTVARERIGQLTQRVGLDHRRRHRVQDLSGGERQRVAICRALMNSPKLLLADEPTGSLDEKSGDAVFALLRELVAVEQVAVVMCTHERRFAQGCDRWLRLREGRMEEA